ncbi:DUF1810 domain-containing protein [uncultured Sphingomonas sp.]|uniref:DUF1810 domain-containing protein n=1 Tax=uncultured Sphingomonas sp. TaxID=158754 RepID=UPI0035C9E460
MTLARFVDAQREVHDRAIAELVAGRKQSHWMWFVFPQIAGLGLSPMARRYAIADMAEARAYLSHPLLSTRLVAAGNAVLVWAGRRSTVEILGDIDAVKLRSSMTLFDLAAKGEGPFAAVIGAFYGGKRDPATIALAGT